MNSELNVLYKIQVEGNEPINISVSIQNIENYGLEGYLTKTGLLRTGEQYVVLNRFIKAKQNFVNGEKTKYRVQLSSISFFRRDSYPEFEDIEEVTPGKAIMAAMRKHGILRFPDNWRDIKASELKNVAQPQE